MATTYTRIQTANSDLNRVQDSVNTAVQGLGQSPFVGGTLLSTQSIGTGVTSIAHMLGYTPTTVFVGPPSANTSVYMPRLADINFIYLQAATACTASVWVK